MRETARLRFEVFLLVDGEPGGPKLSTRAEIVFNRLVLNETS